MVKDITVNATGHGRAILFLHGWGFNGGVWTRQIEHFRPKFACHVAEINPEILPEINEHNFFEFITSELLPQLPLSPIAVVASGFGSFIAYELLECGYEPEKLVLIGPLARFSNGQGYLSGIDPIQVAQWRKELHKNHKKMLESYFYQAFPEEHIPVGKNQILSSFGFDYLEKAFDVMALFDFQEFVSQIPSETLLIQGELDKITPPWQGELMRKLMKNSTLQTIKNAGHLPFISHYSQVNPLITRFMGQPTA